MLTGLGSPASRRILKILVRVGLRLMAKRAIPRIMSLLSPVLVAKGILTEPGRIGTAVSIDPGERVCLFSLLVWFFFFFFFFH